MSQLENISSHVLDTARGVPAAGIRIVIMKPSAGEDDVDALNVSYEKLTEAVTNSDGRANLFFDIQPGIYKVVFFTQSYFDSFGTINFYPKVEITVRVADISKHYHIPLLLSPFGYSTYRGS